MIKNHLARATLLATTLCLAACDKPLEERGCTDEDVQVLARKLLVMQFNDFAKPMTSGERLMQSYGQSSSTQPILNSIKTSALKPDSVQLSEVKALFEPKTPPSERPVGLREASYLYGCSAKARVELAPASAERIAKMPVLAKFTQLDGQKLTLDVIYTTEREGDRRMQVGVAMSHPMLKTLLAVALRNEREPSAEEKAEAASAP
ncbi:hypothetical protein LRS03_11705 [Rhizobacter sp. J219]|jgi:hypothetical protein|uniref:hypothetical protein n=1 Tax=Rhizobacter sp. J219 TaxID=2898430 RepID=UPI002150A120|nr:hypothetical protein [Rhizobacter sp. J219]MCR5883483.1 hypothetical protein [Rhizobacter sp. J219]